MKRWNSSPHPISDVRDWKKLQRLEIRPDFQRKEVWSMAAKIMLMDTIINQIPMPKIFLSSIVKDSQTYRVVIDGQQRISAILDFMEDKFSLVKPFEPNHLLYGKFFSEFPENIKTEFLQYRIDFNEAIGFSEDEVRETYSRLNKYSVALNKQELRRADFPGDFLSLSEKLASHVFFQEIGLFTVANRRRLADVEYVSELLAALISGPQEKKDSLDDFYMNYSKWDEIDRHNIEKRFEGFIKNLFLIFSSAESVSKTRFKQKADFYCLMLAIDESISEGGSIEGKEVKQLMRDLYLLDDLIHPESYQEDMREYAIKCISQANSLASRIWRKNFLKLVLRGTYHQQIPSSQEDLKVFYRLTIGEDDSYCATRYFCSICSGEITEENIMVGWRNDENFYQISNTVCFHRSCLTVCEDDHIAFDEEGLVFKASSELDQEVLDLQKKQLRFFED